MLAEHFIYLSIDAFIIPIERIFLVKIPKRIYEFDVMNAPCRGIYYFIGNFSPTL